ncbi:MAG: hypothetical protein SFU20_08505, partial [Chitinophagaceae bacterium]|nr:hypothetical protein [Chitinophagaceae bacterium]
MRQEITKLAQGSTRFNLSKAGLMELELYVPHDIKEQNAIAELISKVEDEIFLLSFQVESMKTQKSGLMQQLLTGKKRVKVDPD